MDMDGSAKYDFSYFNCNALLDIVLYMVHSFAFLQMMQLSTTFWAIIFPLTTHTFLLICSRVRSGLLQQAGWENMLGMVEGEQLRCFLGFQCQ